MQGAKVDLVDVHKQTVKNLRMWYPLGSDSSNVLEGHAIYVDPHTSVVSCTGAATPLHKQRRRSHASLWHKMAWIYGDRRGRFLHLLN